VAGSRRAAQVRRMPSRSLQRLPPRSPPRSPGRSAPCRARRLAGRAGSRHRHPLPDMQDNKRNILLEPALSASCRMTTGQKIRAAASSPHTTRSRGRPGRCRAPGHPESCRICPHPPQTLELARSPRRFDVPWVSRSRLPDSGCYGLDLAGSKLYSTGVSMPGDEWQPRRLRRDRSRRAGRGGRCPASLRPRGLPAGRPAGSIAASGSLAVTPAARAGSPLRTSQHHHDHRAAPAVTRWHRDNPGRPGQQA
jgi:hypothetical protein